MVPQTLYRDTFSYASVDYLVEQRMVDLKELEDTIDLLIPIRNIYFLIYENETLYVHLASLHKYAIIDRGILSKLIVDIERDSGRYSG